MRHLDPVDRVVTGSVGEPGQRTFYIQVEGPETEWFLLEKQQVAALAERAIEIAKEHGAEADGSVRSIEPDATERFRVGEIGLGIIDDGVAFVLHPVDTDEDEEPVSFRISFEELLSMAVSALADVASGRLPCPACHLPLDPGGHVCPTSNGDLRSR